ncbi:hypothetical protein BJ546DRAFT_1080749 [Cryomyces antarcticus]
MDVGVYQPRDEELAPYVNDARTFCVSSDHCSMDYDRGFVEGVFIEDINVFNGDLLSRSLGDDDVLDLRALLQYFQNHYPSLRLTERDLTNCDEALLAYHHTNSTKPVATAFGSLLQAHMRVDPQRLTQITVNHSDNTYSNSSSNVSSNDSDGDSYSNSDSSSDTSLEDGLQEDDALAHLAVDSGDSPNSKDSRRSSTCITGG